MCRFQFCRYIKPQIGLVVLESIESYSSGLNYDSPGPMRFDKAT